MITFGQGKSFARPAFGRPAREADRAGIRMDAGSGHGVARLSMGGVSMGMGHGGVARPAFGLGAARPNRVQRPGGGISVASGRGASGGGQERTQVSVGMGHGGAARPAFGLGAARPNRVKGPGGGISVASGRGASGGGQERTQVSVGMGRGRGGWRSSTRMMDRGVARSTAVSRTAVQTAARAAVQLRW